jgi:hypothetical protein
MRKDSSFFQTRHSAPLLTILHDLILIIIAVFLPPLHKNPVQNKIYSFFDSRILIFVDETFPLHCLLYAAKNIHDPFSYG